MTADEPAMLQYLPAVQSAHCSTEDAPTVFRNVPTGHSAGVMVPASQKRPVGQGDAPPPATLQ